VQAHFKLRARLQNRENDIKKYFFGKVMSVEFAHSAETISMLWKHIAKNRMSLLALEVEIVKNGSGMLGK
jgi:hypothetical protein